MEGTNDLQLVVDKQIVLELRGWWSAGAFFRRIQANRETLTRWIPAFDQIKTERHVRDELISALKGFEDNTSVILGVRYRKRWVGEVGLYSMDSRGGTAELGYWLESSAERNGIMIRSVKALLRYGFEQRNLYCVWLYIVSDNVRSIALAERAGFTFHGIRVNEQYGQLREERVYRLLRPRWERQQQNQAADLPL